MLINTDEEKLGQVLLNKGFKIENGMVLKINNIDLTNSDSEYWHISVNGEDAKVALRNIRRSCKDEAEKADLPEDQEKMAKEKIQKLTDEYVKKIDELVKEKEKDLMTV